MRRIPTVYVMRAGAPEKIGLEGHLYNVELIDHCNMRDLSRSKIIDILNSGDYILPSDESDYDGLNHVFSGDANILLCKQGDKFLSYSLVRKSSRIYLDWSSIKSGINFPSTNIYSPNKLKYQPNKVWKTDNESGSRGVLINPSRSDFNKFIKEKEKSAIEILRQDLVPELSNDGFELNNYYTLDFQIKNKKLLGYCFVRIPSNSYPRWVRGYITRNKEIDRLVNRVSKYLINEENITDGFINIDGVTTQDYSEFWMYEINWRYSGIGNVLRCLGIDIIYQYIYNIPYQIPIGDYEYCYSYTPVLLPKSGINYTDKGN